MTQHEYRHYRRFMNRLVVVLKTPNRLRTFKQWILRWHWWNSVGYTIKYYLRTDGFSPGQSRVLRDLLAQVEILEAERK